MQVREVVRMLEEDGWYLARAEGSQQEYKHCYTAQHSRNQMDVLFDLRGCTAPTPSAWSSSANSALKNGAKSFVFSMGFQ
jgi:hypothetical protein